MIGKLFKNIIEKYYLNRGLKYFKRAKYEKSEQCFKKALDSKHSDHSSYLLATSLIAQYKHPEAITYLEKIEHREENLLITSTLIECSLVSRNWDKASEIISHIKDSYPNNTLILNFSEIANNNEKREAYALGKEYFFKANQFFDKQEFTEALSSIKKAIEIDEANSSYSYLAGIISVKAKNPKDETIRLFEKAVKLSPQNDNYKKALMKSRNR
jgi:tetratricopeptide (TPR) repeat protein